MRALDLKASMRILVSLLLLPLCVDAASIRIDPTQVKKNNLQRGPAGVNLCWLTASDIHWKRPTTTRQAIREMGMGSLRFPYGHLADNYLWHDLKAGDPHQGLRPRAASSKYPGDAKWAVDKDLYFHSSMDFDEYMELCQALNIKPLVVVNIFSSTYKDGPNVRFLIRTAAAWVKYAKEKGYHVEYWQIGNEVDHHPKWLSKEEYIQRYQRFARAMLAEDPSIKIGPGLLSKRDYLSDVLVALQGKPEQIRFASAHQYMYTRLNLTNYEKWKVDRRNYTGNVSRMAQTILESNRPDLELLVTEINVTPANDKLGKINNTYKALWLAEILLDAIATEPVSFTYTWGLHSGWTGGKDNENNDVGILLRHDDNSRKPSGDVHRLINATLLDEILQVEKRAGFLRCYATSSADKKQLNLIIINRDKQPASVQVEFENDRAQGRTFRKKVLRGDSPSDRSLELTNGPLLPRRPGEPLKITVDPLSITVLSQQ